MKLHRGSQNSRLNPSARVDAGTAADGVETSTHGLTEHHAAARGMTTGEAHDGCFPLVYAAA